MANCAVLHWLTLCATVTAASSVDCIDADCAAQPPVASSLLSTKLLSADVKKHSSELQEILGSLKLDATLTGLLEQNSAILGNAAVDITPGVKQTLKTMVEMIDESILAAIHSHHESTQQTTRSKVSELTQATNFAVSAKEEATYADEEYVQCMRNLEGCQEKHETCTEEEEKLKETAKESCKKAEAKQFYNSDESEHMAEVPVLKCDFAKPPADCKFDEFKAMLAAWADGKINRELMTNRSIYDAAQKICITDTNNFEEKKRECKKLNDECVENHLNCGELEIRRDVAMCTFGDRLQEKCATKTTHEDLLAEVHGTGSAHSDPDRRYEWASAELIKCMLEDHRNGAEFDKATMEKCKPSANYDRDVGVLDLQTDKVKKLNSGDNFDCVQTAMKFSGTEVVTTAGKPYPTYSFNSPHTVTVSLALGTEPFDICATKADAQKCGSNFANCPEGWVPKSDPSTTCALASGCTFADCCE